MNTVQIRPDLRDSSLSINPINSSNLKNVFRDPAKMIIITL